MTNINMEKIISFLIGKWGNQTCPYCGANGWEVQQKPFELREFNNGETVLGGEVIPIIPVTCHNCGNTVLINGLISGVLVKDENPAENKMTQAVEDGQ